MFINKTEDGRNNVCGIKIANGRGQTDDLHHGRAGSAGELRQELPSAGRVERREHPT